MSFWSALANIGSKLIGHGGSSTPSWQTPPFVDPGSMGSDPGGEAGGGSIWSKIAHTIGVGAGKVTGTNPDGSIDWGGMARSGMDVAGSLEKGREAGRADENKFNLTQDQTRMQAMSDKERAIVERAKLEMAQKQDQRTAQSDSFQKVLRGQLAHNLQDVGVNRPYGVPTVEYSGGLRPSAIGEEGRNAGELLSKQAMLSLMNGEQFTPLPGMESFTPSDMKKGNALDTILGTVGTVGGVIDKREASQKADQQTQLIQELLKQAQQTTAAPPRAPVAAGFPDMTDPTA